MPDDDQGIIFANVQLKDTASINQTENILHDLTQKSLKIDGVDYVITVAGYSMLGGKGENVALGVVGLKNWNDRKTKQTSLNYIIQKLTDEFGKNPYAQINFFAPPAIPGVGQSDGLSLELLAAEGNISPSELYKSLQIYLEKLNSSDDLQYAFSTFTSDTPHIFLDVNRNKLESYKIPVSNLFSALQNNLGSRYINNITLFTILFYIEYQRIEKRCRNISHIYGYLASVQR